MEILLHKLPKNPSNVLIDANRLLLNLRRAGGIAVVYAGVSGIRILQGHLPEGIFDDGGGVISIAHRLSSNPHYACPLLFTIRSRMENYATMQLSEISDKEALLDLMGHYYSTAKEHEPVLLEIIDAVHSHTLAVELAARLLEHGLLEPHELLQKLQEEKVALNDADNISITKDGEEASEYFQKATEIYEIIWEVSPELLEAKYQEIGELYPQAGSRIISERGFYYV